MKMKKRILAVGLTASMVLALSPAGAFATSYSALANGGYASDVTTQMSDAGYWTDMVGESADDVMAAAKDIAAVNQAAIDGSGTGSIDITHNYKIKQLTSDAVPTRTYYANGALVDNATYFGTMRDAINTTQWTNVGAESKWGVCVKKTNIKAWPTNDFLGYSATDADDEMQSAGAVVNEPVQIRQKCEVEGHLFYWVNTTNCSGWVDSDCIAICKDKQEWLNAWQVDATAKDFLVVEESGVTTQASTRLPATSKVELQLGCVLKLVASEDIPAAIGERGTWHNYVVYLPTRDADGNYVAQMALLPERYLLSEGYPQFTQANLAKIALGCVGDRYGWGECLDAYDCSAYVRYVYRCFGYELPRNTTQQCKVPGVTLSLAGLNDADKAAVIGTLPIGSALYFSGHTMLYLGTVNGVPYVVSDLGSVVDTDGEAAQSAYGIDITPLTVKRSKETTSGDTTSSRWLTWLDTAVITAPLSAQQAGIKVTSDSSFTYNGTVQQPATSDIHVCNRYGVELPTSCYTLSVDEGHANAGAYLISAAFDNAAVSGTAQGSYTISAKDVSGCSIGSIADQAYTGSAVEPAVTVTDGSAALVAGTDYTVGYEGNVAVGTATVTVAGQGNYAGTAAVTFEIVKSDSWTDAAATVNAKAAAAKTAIAKLTMLSAAQVTAYSSKVDEAVKAVIAAIDVSTTKDAIDEAEQAGLASIDEVLTSAKATPGSCFIAKGNNKTKTSQKITWAKSDKAMSYKVYRAKVGSSKYKRVATTAKASAISKGLKKGATYKYYVIGCSKAGGKGVAVCKSPVIVVATSSALRANASKVTLTAKVTTLKVGTSTTVKGKVAKRTRNRKLSSKGCVATIRYVSSNTSVATVSKAGKVTAKCAGSSYIYAIAGNGKYKRVKIDVK